MPRGFAVALLVALPAWALGASFEPAKLPELSSPLSAPRLETGLPSPLSAALQEPVPALPETLVPGVLPAAAQLPVSALPGVGADVGPLHAADAPAQASFGAREGRGGWSKTYRSFEEWGDDFRKAEAPDREHLADSLFDNGALHLGRPEGFLPPAAAPKIPVGVRSVMVDSVVDARDIGRLIPRGINSADLIDKLVENIGEMGEYRIYTYHANKGKFVGIDLSARPELVDLLPEQHSHEVRLIKKIQAFNEDLRVLVREDGKTPDLVVSGVVTELKSLIGDKVDLTYLVDKANTQVLEHAHRHGLGNGAAVIDLTAERKVPVQAVLKEINAWARMPRGTVIPGGYLGARHLKQEPALDRITVFAGEDVKVFGRGKDGSYRALDERPFAEFTPSNPRRVSLEKIDPVKRGMLADAFEKSRILADLRGFYERGRHKRALKAWKKFVDTHDEDLVRATAPQAEALLERIRRKMDAGRKFRRPGGRRR